MIVEGVHMIKKHMRKSQQHPQGAIVEREGTIHISNVMKAEAFDARAAKAGQNCSCCCLVSSSFCKPPTARLAAFVWSGDLS